MDGFQMPDWVYELSTGDIVVQRVGKLLIPLTVHKVSWPGGVIETSVGSFRIDPAADSPNIARGIGACPGWIEAATPELIRLAAAQKAARVEEARQKKVIEEAMRQLQSYSFGRKEFDYAQASRFLKMLRGDPLDGQWTPCQQSLPDELTPVRVTYIGSDGNRYADMIAVHKGLSWYWWDNFPRLGKATAEITHWMPLSGPPDD